MKGNLLSCRFPDRAVRARVWLGCQRSFKKFGACRNLLEGSMARVSHS